MKINKVTNLWKQVIKPSPNKNRKTLERIKISMSLQKSGSSLNKKICPRSNSLTKNPKKKSTNQAMASLIGTFPEVLFHKNLMKRILSIKTLRKWTILLRLNIWKLMIINPLGLKWVKDFLRFNKIKLKRSTRILMTFSWTEFWNQRISVQVAC